MMTAPPRGIAPVTAVVLLLAALASPSAVAAPAGWHKDIRIALAEAQKSGKPVLADFSASWCPGCVQLERVTFVDPTVRDRLEDFVPVYVDTDKYPDVMRSYGVKALPTLIMLTPNGQVISKNVGFMPPTAFVGKLDSALQKVPAPARSEAPERAVAEAASEERTPRSVSEPVIPAKPVTEVARATPAPADLEAERRAAEREQVIAAIKRTQRDLGSNPKANFYVASASGERFAAPAPSIVTKVVSESIAPRFEGVAEENPVLAATQQRPRTVATVAQAAANELPKPLLNAGATRGEAKPGSVTTVDDPLATIRLLEGTPAISKTPAAPATPAVAPPAPSPAAKPADTAAKPAEQPKPAADQKKASAEDINRWMRDGDSKLREDRKREARAMYEQVCEADPKNEHGFSDLAFVRAASLIVDQDDDALRRRAYDRIKEFPGKFPNSKHMDYYTVIRAMLAADLGEKEEAAKLVFDFPERFKGSRYGEMAYDLWNSVKDAKPAAPRSTPRPATSGTRR